MEHIQHLILPYYFNVRHYLELEFKALYVGLTNMSFMSLKGKHDLHNLEKLYEAVKGVIETINVCDEKEKLCRLIEKIGKMLDEYLKLEYSSDYYRYIFSKDMTLEKPDIVLDYKNTDQLFRQLARAINVLNCLIHSMLKSISGRTFPYTF